MKTLFLTGILILSVVLHTYAQQLGTKTYRFEDSKAFKESEKLLKGLVGTKVPGLAIVVTYKNKVLWEAGYGYADVKKKTRIQPNKTLFRIASISKPITAVGLGKMYDDGVIALDSSVYTYLPNFPKKQYDITIKQLASHTAGIRTYKGNEFFNRKYMTITEGLRMFDTDTLLYEPGKGYLYNSNDWNVVAAAMESASNTDFEKYMKTEIFTPLGLTNIIADKNEYLPNKAVFYSSKRKGKFRVAPKVNNYYKLPSGGYLATATAISKFGNKILYNQFLKPQTKALLLTNQMVNGAHTYYGLGWMVSMDKARRPYYGHVGNGVGGYGYFYVYPEEEMVIVILMNVSDPGVSETIHKIIDLVITEKRASVKLLAQ